MAYSIKLGEGGDRPPQGKRPAPSSPSVPLPAAVGGAAAAILVLVVVLWLQLGGSNPNNVPAFTPPPQRPYAAAASLPGLEDTPINPAASGQASTYPGGWALPAGADPNPDALPSDGPRTYTLPAGADPDPDALPGEAGR
ncbi:MAG: hypothetical protein ACK47B_23285 [Armatimonadota bacterium]